ncbi:MAG: hypothetical protein M9898_07270 [Chitinophagaceae bacterium]|nr:hypothetical protein [Chitinophagaceae bacterium]
MKNWTIDNQSHLDEGIAGYIENVFTLTADHIFNKLGKPPLGVKPISLKYDCIHGPIVYWPLQPDKYEIGICVDGIFPHQIIFQMAHELCHIYVDPRMNGVFTEIVCHKTAFDVLEDIGVPLTQAGQQAVDHYFEDAKVKAEQKKSLSLNSIDLEWIKQTISCLEHTNTLLDREINNLISLKLKEVIDPIDKYGLIKHVKNSVDNPPNSDINDLTTIPITKVNLTRLIENIEKENKELASALQIWK